MLLNTGQSDFTGEQKNMRSIKFAVAVLVAMVPFTASSEIIFGGYTFDDNAFADNATVLESGSVSGPLSSLTGFTPTSGLFNIGFGESANLFQLDFTDLLAANLAGSDLVFFDARFSADPYSIAVRAQGGTFTSFIDFLNPASYINTGEAGPLGSSTLFALEIDLDLFGIGAGAIVDAIQFRALPRVGATHTEGDPVMAGVLNPAGQSTAVPEPGTLALFGLGLLGMGFAKRQAGRVTQAPVSRPTS